MARFISTPDGSSQKCWLGLNHEENQAVCLNHGLSDTGLQNRTTGISVVTKTDLFWRNPTKGATPVPGPTMMRGVAESTGRRNPVLLRRYTGICNNSLLSCALKGIGKFR